MKTRVYLSGRRSTFLIIYNLLIALFFSVSGFSQSLQEYKYNAVIPKGQKLYSENTKDQKDLKPFKNEYYEISGIEKIKVIESGDFVLKEYTEGGVTKQDTLWFAIYEMRIVQGDTIKSSHKMELEKQNNFSIKASLIFEGDKILITQSDDQDFSIHSKFRKEKHNVHPDDEGLYFKLGPEEEFEFLTKSPALNLMFIPFRFRGSTEEGISDVFAEAKLNNIELFFGFRTIRNKYSNGKFKKSSFSLGPYVGPTIIDLDHNNSNQEVGVERSKAGVTYGLAILGSIERVSLGLVGGTESTANNKELGWIFNNKLYVGFTLGYSLNEFN